MYGAIGSWFWHERTPENSLSSLLLTYFCTFNQAWFMGLFFLLVRTYVPASLARKGAFKFLLDRSLRLGIPLLVFGNWLTFPATWCFSQQALWVPRRFGGWRCRFNPYALGEA
jgi:hypothetical protein